MADAQKLKSLIKKIDGRGYNAYKELKGFYQFADYILDIVHVQGDPFATPSRLRILISREKAAFPGQAHLTKSREAALRDFVNRKFFDSCKKFSKGNRGTGKSGLITIDEPGQEILERTTVFIHSEELELRFFCGLPAHGRRIAGGGLIQMLFDELPNIVKDSLFYSSLDSKSVFQHLELNEDADFLRNALSEKGLISFVADGAILPRRSGVDDRPLVESNLENSPLVPFASPDSMRVEVDLPNKGKITGMGVSKGITLIVGGGFHGKSTLLRAIERGIYNHIPGDGREYVVTDSSAIKIRSEDGRSVTKVTITPFISNLPYNIDTDSFSTANASGSTSQAANIIEAMEAGSRVLLLDEDTSATNFMIRDHRMRELISKDMEPITPFIDKVEQLYREKGISTVLVMGGSGDYFDVSDFVISLDKFRPLDISEKARAIANKHKKERSPEGGDSFGLVKERFPRASSMDASSGRREVKISNRGLDIIQFGRSSVDIRYLEQIVDEGQLRAIGYAMHYIKQFMKENISFGDIIKEVCKKIDREGLDMLSPAGMAWDFAHFRALEFAFAVNRLRTLEMA